MTSANANRRRDNFFSTVNGQTGYSLRVVHIVYFRCGVANRGLLAVSKGPRGSPTSLSGCIGRATDEALELIWHHFVNHDIGRKIKRNFVLRSAMGSELTSFSVVKKNSYPRSNVVVSSPLVSLNVCSLYTNYYWNGRHELCVLRAVSWCRRFEMIKIRIKNCGGKDATARCSTDK